MKVFDLVYVPIVERTMRILHALLNLGRMIVFDFRDAPNFILFTNILDLWNHIWWDLLWGISFAAIIFFNFKLLWRMFFVDFFFFLFFVWFFADVPQSWRFFFVQRLQGLAYWAAVHQNLLFIGQQVEIKPTGIHGFGFLKGELPGSSIFIVFLKLCFRDRSLINIIVLV